MWRTVHPLYIHIRCSALYAPCSVFLLGRSRSVKQQAQLTNRTARTQWQIYTSRLTIEFSSANIMLFAMHGVLYISLSICVLSCLVYSKCDAMGPDVPGCARCPDCHQTAVVPIRFALMCVQRLVWQNSNTTLRITFNTTHDIYIRVVYRIGVRWASRSTKAHIHDACYYGWRAMWCVACAYSYYCYLETSGPMRGCATPRARYGARNIRIQHTLKVCVERTSQHTHWADPQSKTPDGHVGPYDDEDDDTSSSSSWRCALYAMSRT